MEEKIEEIDLKKLEGKGDFSCPACGTVLSPEDESEEKYKVLDAESDESFLSALILQCKCGKKIKLIGFRL